MRITGGTLRGRNLRAPDGHGTRPTSDRVREALFNILAHHEWGPADSDALEGALVLDAFGGTGALGIEAISRGAARAVFFEKDRKALRALHENVAFFGLQDRAAIIPSDVTRPPKAHAPATLIFLDPPYRKGLIAEALTALRANGWIAPDAVIVTETAKNEEAALPAGYELLLSRTYGDTSIGFYKALPPVE